jgi:broad specificity phosphatase PhoE
MNRTVTFFLFRHGETDWNAEGRFQGHLDIPLNEVGKKQARTLGKKFRSSGTVLDAILSSDLSRAVTTAEIAAQEAGFPSGLIFQDQGIREAYLGNAQGLTLPEIKKQFGEEVTSRWRSNRLSDADISYPGGETGTAVIERTKKTLRSFVEAHPEFSKIGVATHGGVIRRFMHWVLVQEGKIKEHIPIPNGVVYEVLYNVETSSWRVVK